MRKKHAANALVLVMVPILFSLLIVQAANSKSGFHTPGKGSAERAGILNALRADLHKNDKRKIVFVVKNLKVHNGWAWVDAVPQTPDGKFISETVSALEHLKKGHWSIVGMPSGEGSDEAIAYNKKFLQQMKTKYPSMPRDILPHY